MKEPEYKDLVTECARRQQGVQVSEPQKYQNKNVLKKN